MTTINGVTFNMRNLRPVAVHRNSVSEQPGSDTNFITDMGYDGLVLRLEGYEESLATYDSVISEFMKSGEQTLVHRTGWQFKVYSVQLTPELIEGIVDNYFPYDLILYTSTPYRESTTETTRSKTITTNNQEWSADDSANDIDTGGSVDAVPDFKITGDTGTATVALAVEPVSEPGFETITNWTYSEVDTTGNIFGGQNSTYEYEGTYCYEVNISTGALINEYGQITQTGVNFDTIGYFTFMQRFIKTNAYGDVCRLTLTIGGVQYGSWDSTTSGDSDSGWVEKSVDVSDVVGTKDVVFKSTLLSSGLTGIIYSLLDSVVSKKKSVTVSPAIYNTSDSTIQCQFGTILDGAIHEVYADGTGTIQYSDDFTTGKYKYDALDILNITHDTIDDEIDIADDGYIYWLIDTKGPVTGIPILTAQINITTGTPTIQISTDASTWYDITTAIVDDVDTVYELDSSSLHLKGQTSFYWRIDCVKAGAATCSVKSFELDINIVTIDFEHPKITAGGAASTFRCDQDASSGMNCTVALIYRDRSWPA